MPGVTTLWTVNSAAGVKRNSGALRAVTSDARPGVSLFVGRLDAGGVIPVAFPGADDEIRVFRPARVGGVGKQQGSDQQADVRVSFHVSVSAILSKIPLRQPVRFLRCGMPIITPSSMSAEHHAGAGVVAVVQHDVDAGGSQFSIERIGGFLTARSLP
jgi:hypothetical protein